MSVSLEYGQDYVGALNVNTLVRAGKEEFLIRHPFDNPRLFRHLEDEYRLIGFWDAGGRFRRRNSEEQAHFSQKAANMGLRVLPPGLQLGSKFCYRFLSDAKSLDCYLPTSGLEAIPAIHQLFNDLWDAHQRGIIYGDRWSQNVLISPKFGPLHIDFDLEILGRFAKDFEVAQLSYYTAIATPSSAILSLAREIATPGWFHPELLFRFLRGHVRYFSNSSYGDHRGIIEELINQISTNLAIHNGL